MQAGHTHETFARDKDVKMGTDRGFGLTFALVFAVLGVWPAIALRGSPHFEPARLRWWCLALAIAFLVAALLASPLLRPLNSLWFKFGLLLSTVMTPIMMGILFVLAVVPTGLVMRLWGQDLLRQKFDRQAKSYWIMREPPGPARESMRNQY